MTAVSAPSSCLLCGAPEPFGLSVCPACGGGAHAVGDTLVFVRPAETEADVRRAAEALERLLAGRAHVSEQTLVAAGHRALIRIPAASADAAVRQLALRGIPAEARPAARAWAPAPRTFYLLLAAIVLVGLAAAMRAEPLLRWTTPLYAGMLVVAAQLRLRQPALGTPARRRVFSLATERLLVEIFAGLPAGTARDLLTRLVRVAEPLFRAYGRQGAGTRCREVEQLLVAACRAAEDLADLDGALDGLSGGTDVRRVATIRDAFAARLRDGVVVLHRLRAEAADDAPAHEELTRLIAALDEEAGAFAAAREELAQLLPAPA